MLERRRILLSPTPIGFSLTDGDTAESIGTATRNHLPDPAWLGWLPDVRRRPPRTLEVREPPDDSLVFTLSRSARRDTLIDGQDHTIWIYRATPNGKSISTAKSGVAAHLSDGVIIAGTGLVLGTIVIADTTRVEFAPELDWQPFEKMLVLGAALGLLMDATGRRSAS